MAAEHPLPRTREIRPPLGSWGRLYGLVLGALVLEVALLWVLGRALG